MRISASAPDLLIMLLCWLQRCSMPEKNLRKLSRMIEDALDVAVEMNETTAIYLLSMASIDVTEKIRSGDRAASDDAE